MKLAEIVEGKLQDQARAEAAEMARHNAGIETIIDSYRNGHIHLALALKQLCHHKLTLQQAKSRLITSNP